MPQDIPHILALFDQQERREAQFPDVERQEAPPLVRNILPEGQRSFIIYSDFRSMDAAAVDAVIQREITFFGENQRDVEWKVYAHDQPPDLVSRLVANGFEQEESETILVLDLAAASPVLKQSVTADIRHVDPHGHIDDAIRDILLIEETVWETEMAWLGERLAHQLRQYPDYCSVYIAYADDQPASCAWINYPAGSSFAGLWGGSTLSQFRGRGLYTALLAARAQEALSRGKGYLTIDASDMSQPIVEKYGFIAVSSATSCVKHPSSQGLLHSNFP